MNKKRESADAKLYLHFTNRPNGKRCFVRLHWSQRYRPPYITMNKFYWRSQRWQQFPSEPFHVGTCFVIPWYLSLFLDKRWCYPKTGSNDKVCEIAYFVVVTLTKHWCHIRTIVHRFWKCIIFGEQRNNIFRGPYRWYVYSGPVIFTPSLLQSGQEIKPMGLRILCGLE